jgi:hypothetical protein
LLLIPFTATSGWPPQTQTGRHPLKDDGLLEEVPLNSSSSTPARPLRSLVLATLAVLA